MRNMKNVELDGEYKWVQRKKRNMHF